MKNTTIHPELEDISFLPVGSHREFREFMEHYRGLITQYRGLESQLLENNPNRRFSVKGFCHCCNDNTEFLVEGSPADSDTNKPRVNWRETMKCRRCGLINRVRATYHYIEQALGLGEKLPTVYISEQTTPLYTFLSNKIETMVGSEYLADSIPFGSESKQGIRNETATALTFNDATIDAYLSFDVFEHIPDYEQAFREAYRVLKKGGKLILSVPFAGNSETNIIRAKQKSDGTVEHLLPPEYHGDPVSSKGVLCFQIFGWQMLDSLRKIGFVEANAYIYLSERNGYLGDIPFIFMATK